MLHYKKGLHDHGSSDAEGNKNSCVKKYYLATVAILCFFWRNSIISSERFKRHTYLRNYMYII